MTSEKRACPSCHSIRRTTDGGQFVCQNCGRRYDEPASRVRPKDWYTPHPREIKPAAYGVGLSLAEVADRSDHLDARESLYGLVSDVERSVSAQMVRDVRRVLVDAGSETAKMWVIPSVESIERERERRDIASNHFSMALGYQNEPGWRTCYESADDASLAILYSARRVFMYYDRNGYLPEP